jgi:hypothetical protein
MITKALFSDVLSGTYAGMKVAVKTLKDGLFHDLLVEARFMMFAHFLSS